MDYLLVCQKINCLQKILPKIASRKNNDIFAWNSAPGITGLFCFMLTQAINLETYNFHPTNKSDAALAGPAWCSHSEGRTVGRKNSWYSLIRKTITPFQYQVPQLHASMSYQWLKPLLGTATGNKYKEIITSCLRGTCILNLCWTTNSCDQLYHDAGRQAGRSLSWPSPTPASHLVHLFSIHIAFLTTMTRVQYRSNISPVPATVWCKCRFVGWPLCEFTRHTKISPCSSLCEVFFQNEHSGRNCLGNKRKCFLLLCHNVWGWWHLRAYCGDNTEGHVNSRRIGRQI